MKLDIELDPSKKAIRGTATHTVAPFKDDLEAAEFDCAELTVSRVRVGRTDCSFHQEDGKLVVELPRAPRKGKPLDIAITYEGTPRRGLYFTGPDEHHPDKPLQIWTQGQDEDSRFWFPCFDYPNEKQTSELICTVPYGLEVLSNGRLVKSQRSKRRGTATFHWRLDEPHVTYLIMLAAGDFEVHEVKWRGVPVTYWAPRGRLADARRTLARTPQMMTLFSKKTGVDYPYPQYAQVFVQDFIFGGMENTTATTLTDTAILDRHAAKENWMDALIAHELGHQWFGDLVTCRDWSQGWLNEGFATFMETVWKRHKDGDDEVAYYRIQDADNYLAEDAGRYRRPIVCRTYYDPIEIFDRHLYEKGGLVLHMLERELGEDVFWASVNHYLERHAGGSVVTDDLRRAVEDTSGRNLEWFFDQWVHHGGHPALRVKASQTDGAVTVEVHQTQKVDALTPLFRFDVGVRIRTDRRTYERELEIRDAHHTFVIEVAGKLRWLAFDPGAHLLHSGRIEQSEEAWIEALAKDRDGATRVRAARALVERGTPASIRALKRALGRDALWFVRKEAVRALARIGGDAARGALISARSQPDPRVRRKVALALGGFRHDEKAAAALLDLIGPDEKSPGVLHDACVALGRTRSSHALDVLPTMFDRKSWNESAWRGALTGLGELHDDSAIDTLLAQTALDRPNHVRAAATGALAKLGEKDLRVRERLEELVIDPALRVQLTAIAALVDRLEEKSIPVLQKEAARALDGRVRRNCVVAAESIARGRDRGDDVRNLREQVGTLRADNRKLADRIAKLESRRRR